MSFIEKLFMVAKDGLKRSTGEDEIQENTLKLMRTFRLFIEEIINIQKGRDIHQLTFDKIFISFRKEYNKIEKQSSRTVL